LMIAVTNFILHLLLCLYWF